MGIKNLNQELKMKAVKIAAMLASLLVVLLVSVNAENARTIKQEMAKSHVLLGLSYVKLGDPVNAAVEFEKALKTDPATKFKRAEISQFYFDLGMIYIMNYELQGALPFFAKAARLAGGNPRPVTAVALVYSLLAEDALENGRPDQAREYYAQCLEIKPDFDPDQVYACLTQHCCLMVKIDQVNTDFAATYCAIAREYEKEKMYDKAHEYYRLALELVPGSLAARQGITNTAEMMNLQNDATVAAVN